MMADIRKGTLADIPQLVELGALMHAESPRFSGFAFLPDRLKGNITLIMGMLGGYVSIAEKDGQVIGGFVAVATPHYACDVLQASDLALFIHPDHRGSTIAARLVRAYVTWAKGIGAEPNISLNTGVQPERTADLLRALGGVNTGSVWTWGAICA